MAGILRRPYLGVGGGPYLGVGGGPYLGVGGGPYLGVGGGSSGPAHVVEKITPCFLVSSHTNKGGSLRRMYLSCMQVTYILQETQCW